uniref:Uncharacterized protein n=1 Tax=Trichobilharzia regenti TaxID=157069 RepID=A0AA85K6S7_TRIRE|nr:unnamed protein product [Trichobilharzia regenti]
MGRSHSQRSSSSALSEKQKSHHHSKQQNSRSNHKKTKRKSSSRNTSKDCQKAKLLNLTKAISTMIDSDKKRNRSEKHKNKLPSCGCPYDCESEIQALRKNIENLRSGLSHSYKDRPIFQLEHFIDDHYQLLSEAWLSIGQSKLRDLVSASLLSICARRERRDAKHSSNKSPRVSCIVQPFVSFDGSDYQLGVSELWHRCIRELDDLSVEQVRTILNGTGNLDPTELVHNSSSNKAGVIISDKDHKSRSKASMENKVDEKISDKQIHDADSTTALCSRQTIGSSFRYFNAVLSSLAASSASLLVFACKSSSLCDIGHISSTSEI